MNETQPGAAKTPWHFWVIGVLALLWYASGAYVIQMAQLGLLPDIEPDEAAYYAAQPLWLNVTTGFATYGSVLASILLLLRKAVAVPAFAIALALILLNDGIELARGTSRVYANTGAAVVTGIIAVIAVFMVWYAWKMKQHSVLR